MKILDYLFAAIKRAGNFFWILLIIVVCGVIFGVYKNRSKDNLAVQTQTGQVEKGNLTIAVKVSGNVSATNITQLKTQVSGVVTKLYVKDGEAVKSGQKIADIELDDSGRQKYYQALSTYQSAKNNLDSASSTLYSLNSSMYAANVKLINDAVARDLAADDPTYVQQSSDWLAAESKYKNQQESIKQARTNLSSSYLLLKESSPTITAPISGEVSGLSYQAGSVISNSSESTVFANVITASKPTVKVLLTESDISKVKIGNISTITFDALPEISATGKIVSIDKAGTTTSGVNNYPVYIQLDTENKFILPNMAATANIITDLITDTLIVPSSAIKTQNNISTVTLADGRSVEVTTGKSNETQTEIKSGLKEGDSIVVSTITKTSVSTTGQSTSPFGRQSGFGGGSINVIRR
jgi:membrane fusion protein, macrolide-specific efflux system